MDLLALSMENFDEFFSFDVEEPVEDIPQIMDVNNNYNEEDMASADQLLDELIDLLSPDELNTEQTSMEANAVVQPAVVEAMVDVSTVEPTDSDMMPTVVHQPSMATLQPVWGDLNLPTVSDPGLVPTVVQEPTSTALFKGLIDKVNINGQEVFFIAVDSSWKGDCPKPSRGRPRKKAEKMSPYVADKSERKKLQDQEASRKYRDNKRAQEALERIEVQVLETKNRELKSDVTALELELENFKNANAGNVDQQISLVFQEWDLTMQPDAAQEPFNVNSDILFNIAEGL